ncbi:hypothetical protein Bbelb_030010 [Branchiostoma belcheri]|nr:hypothetical protein Bbelb_030010 [Branchiostoma belcheri]
MRGNRFETTSRGLGSRRFQCDFGAFRWSHLKPASGRRDLIVRTPRGTPPVAGIPPGHISYVTDQMNRIKPMPARLVNPAGASRGYIPDGHRPSMLVVVVTKKEPYIKSKRSSTINLCLESTGYTVTPSAFPTRPY